MPEKKKLREDSRSVGGKERKEKRKGQRGKGEGLNCGAGTEAVAAIVGTVAADVEPVVAPEDVRNKATGVARTRAEGDVLDIQMVARLPEIPQLKQEPLEKGDALHVALLELVRRKVSHLLVGFHSIAEALSIGRIGGAVVHWHGFVQVVPKVRIRRELLLALGQHPIQSGAVGNHDHPAEAGLLLRNHDAGEIHGETKDLLVELLPRHELARRHLLLFHCHLLGFPNRSSAYRR